MKKIYELVINKKELVDKTEVIKDDKGGEITQIKKIEEMVAHKFFMARPNRSQVDESEIFRAATESEYIRRGVISATLLQKRLLNDGGVLTEQEKKEYDTLRETFIEKQAIYAKIIEENKTEEQKNQTQVLIKELGDIMERMGQIENSSSSLYNRTAETLARNKTILWLTLNLSYEEKDGKNVPVFGAGDYEARLKKYDEIEEREDEFEYSIIKKLLLICNLWYLGKATTKEDFETYLRIQESSDLLS
jgi:hypothetical protein